MDVSSGDFPSNRSVHYRNARDVLRFEKTNLRDTTKDAAQFGRELLDYLSTPTDSAHPSHDFGKAVTRNLILKTVGYTELKVDLFNRGIDHSGDVDEMLIRAALYLVDPTIKYSVDK